MELRKLIEGLLNCATMRDYIFLESLLVKDFYNFDGKIHTCQMSLACHVAQVEVQLQGFYLKSGMADIPV